MYPLFAEFITGENRWQVCLADCPDYMNFEALSDALYTEHLRGLEQTDILIVRPRVDRPLDLSAISPGDLLSLQKRAPRASLHVLFSSGYVINLSSNLNRQIDDKLETKEVQNAFLKWLQDKEFYYYMKESNCLFQARAQFLYRAPSQRYVNMFLRVGNIQRSRQVLDAFFFWMIPHLREKNAILTDTWSISSIALNAGRFLERYWSHLPGEKGSDQYSEEGKCRVDMLSTYPDELALVTPETRDALLRVGENGKRKVLVLLSAVATGNSLRQLRETVHQIPNGENEFSFLALYKLDDACPAPYLCDLSSGISGMKFTAVSREEAENRAIIEIDKRTYFPIDIKETTLEVRLKHAAPAKEFFSYYRNSSVISLHRDALDLSNQEHRHHGIYVDVKAMLSASKFRDKLQSELSQITRTPCLIVTPPHDAGTMLANYVQKILSQRLGAPTPILVHPDLHPSSPDLPKQINSASEEEILLIVDDVSVTGRRLSRYQQSLRELRFKGQIVYLVGVARPETEKHWTRRQIELSYRTGSHPRHLVISVETVILPDWDRKNCPWCAESNALLQLSQRGLLNGPTLSEVKGRLMALERARHQQGLVNDALWRPEGCNPLLLTPNSMFVDVEDGPAAEADVIAAVAAAIQRMRTATEEERLALSYPHVSVLDPTNYFGTKFNDDLLRLAMIRTAKAEELERWESNAEETRRKHVKDFLVGDSNQDVFRLELAVARLSRKVPSPELSAAAWDGLQGWPAKLWKSISKSL